MSFARYFRISSFCLIASGFVAIAATGALDLPSIVLFSAALIASCFIDTGRLHRRLSGWVLNSLTLAYFPLYLVDYKFLSRSYMVSTLHLVFFVAALKLLTQVRDRDYVFLYLISFAELLAASTLSIDMTFALSLGIFLLSAVSTLMLFEMRRSNARALEKGSLQPPVIPSGMDGTGLELFSRFPAGKVAAISLISTLMIVLVAIPLFFLLPRRSLGLLNRPSGQTQFISGFSEKVELGEIGRIKESDAVVMRVKISQQPAGFPQELKWRGIALDRYDGRVWSRSDLRRRAVTQQEAGFYKVEEYSHGRTRISQTFFLEALSTDVVFAARKVLAVSRDIGFIQRDSSDGLYTLRHMLRKLRYVAISELPDAMDPPLDSGSWPIPEEVKQRFLQLPREDPRIAELAKEVTKGQTSPYGKARALERFLRENYSYSLELRGSPKSKDPLAAFLFDIRRGHCEYFASALAIMLRELGIPSRLVNGFRMGEYNSIGGDWTVRQYDAHSWVEAYFAPSGWYEFDPTPPDLRPARPAFTRMLANLVDAVDLWWWEEVVSYDFRKQYELVSSLRLKLSEYQERLRNFLSSARAGIRSGVQRIETREWIISRGPVVLVPVLVMTGAWFLLRRHPGLKRRLARCFIRLRARRDESALITSFYAEALDLLRSRGLTRTIGQTPLEFARSLENQPAARPLGALTHLYNRVRFGPAVIGDHTSEARALLDSLRKSLPRTLRRN